MPLQAVIPKGAASATQKFCQAALETLPQFSRCSAKSMLVVMVPERVAEEVGRDTFRAIWQRDLHHVALKTHTN